MALQGRATTLEKAVNVKLMDVLGGNKEPCFSHIVLVPGDPIVFSKILFPWHHQKEIPG